MTEPEPILTVGDLKSELGRWSDETPVTFRSPLREQEFRFYRYRPGENLLVLEINEFPETLPEVLPGA
ncbi:MAG TPA: hypothetical protein VHQ48_11080 [Bradyrhizobium sp.]|jgi:hypothetical protein|nr:hypothetical protein [Bradyrhizobium sp.]